MACVARPLALKFCVGWGSVGALSLMGLCLCCWEQAFKVY